MNPKWLALSAALVALRFLLYAFQLMFLTKRPAKLRFGQGLGIAFIIYGFGAIMPAAPTEGFAISSRILQRLQQTKQQSRVILGLSYWFSQRTFYAIAALDLLVVVALGHLSFTQHWPFVVLSAAVIVALVITAKLASQERTAERFAIVIGALRLGRARLNVADLRHAGHELHTNAMKAVGSPRNRAQIAITSALAVVADAGVLFTTLRAANVVVHFELVILATITGVLVSWIPLVPGGFGLVEAAIPTMLASFGAPLSAALSATVLYRAFGAIIPALIGLAAIPSLRTSSAPTRDERDSPSKPAEQGSDLPTEVIHRQKR